jgi:hypothetical protein
VRAGETPEGGRPLPTEPFRYTSLTPVAPDGVGVRDRQRRRQPPLFHQTLADLLLYVLIGKQRHVASSSHQGAIMASTQTKNSAPTVDAARSLLK